MNKDFKLFLRAFVSLWQGPVLSLPKDATVGEFMNHDTTTGRIRLPTNSVVM